MSQYFFNELNLESARQRYEDRLYQMDQILFPDGSISLLSEKISADIAEQAIVSAFERRLHQGTVSGNLEAFGRCFCPGFYESYNGHTIQSLICFLDENSKAIRSNIQEEKPSGNGNFFMHLLFLATASCAVASMFDAVGVNSVEAAGLPAATMKPTVLAAAIGTAPEQNSSPLGIILIVAALGIGGFVVQRVFGLKPMSKEHTRQEPPRPRLCSEKEALEVLSLIEALAEIYRNDRQ